MRAGLPLLALALASALAGCSGRDRANPLDPANPQTGGRPVGFNAIAGDGLVTIQWTPQPSLAIDGFDLERLAPGDSLYRALVPVLRPDQSTYTDVGTANGKRYHYRLYYVIRGARENVAAEDEATSGPAIAWVADPGAGELLRLSPDARDVVSIFTDLGSPQSLAVDPDNGRVWTSDSYGSTIGTFDPAIPGSTLIPGVPSPFTLAVTPLDHSAWVCDLSGSLWHFRSDGSAATPGRIDLLDIPDGVAVNRLDYSVWVCESAGNRVRHYASTGVALATALVPSPSRVAVDSASGIAWVTSLSRGRIWRVGANGALVDSSAAASGPIGVTVDRAHARVWVADAGGNRVLGLDLTTMLPRVTVTAIAQPRDVSVDPATGEVWVVSQADRNVVRLAPDGTVLDRSPVFVSPYEVRVDPGR